MAKRLGMDLRESDILSRISGDEFMLLLNPIQSEAEVAEYIHFILQRLKAPFFIDESEIFASTSIGVSLYPEHGKSYDVLRQNADIAMYRVKNGSKGGAAFFDASMEREALARMKVEQSLRLAILEKRFCCAFQTKVDIRTKAVKGIEALVRLKDDEGVIQAPGTFINLAVELGLIDELTHLVLAEIVKSIDLINETFGPDTTISINVAAKQAGNPEFMRPFAQALEATGFPKRFMIEVTEDAFVTKTHFQDEILPIFRKLGVGISIDDFGIGYSSLSALADITADEIKIDRSFITDIHLAPAQPGHFAGDRIAERSARHDRDRRRHRDLRGTGLSAGRDQDPLRAGLLLLQADFPGRPQAGDTACQRSPRQPVEPPGPGKPPGFFARQQLSPLREARLRSVGQTHGQPFGTLIDVMVRLALPTLRHIGSATSTTPAAASRCHSALPACIVINVIDTRS